MSRVIDVEMWFSQRVRIMTILCGFPSPAVTMAHYSFCLGTFEVTVFVFFSIHLWFVNNSLIKLSSISPIITPVPFLGTIRPKTPSMYLVNFSFQTREKFRNV